jgi:putative inorganic carbon (HCO3(-)) transporter
MRSPSANSANRKPPVRRPLGRLRAPAAEVDAPVPKEPPGVIDAAPVVNLRWMLGLFKGQPFCFFATLAYLVLEYVRPQTVYPQLDILPWTQIAILSGVASLVPEIQRRGFTRTPETALLATFTLVLLISVGLSNYPQEFLKHYDLFIPWLFIYVLIINSITTRERFFIFLMLFLLCTFKMSQHGFRTWMESGFGFSSWGVSGAPGFFQNSGEVGIQMCIYLPLSVCCVLALRHKMKGILRWVMWAMPFTAAATIIASNSRGAMIGAVVTLLWFALTSPKRWRILAISAVVIWAGLLVMPEQTWERFNDMGTDDTSQARLLYWTKGWLIMKTYPFFGVGFANWTPYFAAHWAAEVRFFKGIELPHNIFVQVGAELGFTGLAVYLAMIVYTFIINARTRAVAAARGFVFEHWVSRGLDGGMIGYLVSAQFISVVYYPYFWIGMAMAVALNRATNDGYVAAVKMPRVRARPALVRAQQAAVKP